MDHLIFHNIITDEEQSKIIDYAESRKNNMDSYSKYSEKYLDTLPVGLIPLNNEEEHPDFIRDIIKRIRDLLGVSSKNYRTWSGWGISYGFIGSGVINHKDPVNKDSGPNDILIRMNTIVQNTDKGGNFVFHYPNQNKIINVPEKALMVFPASEIDHSVTKNRSHKIRLNFSIDTIVDKSFWEILITKYKTHCN
jgi:hypothetical protein